MSFGVIMVNDKVHVWQNNNMQLGYTVNHSLARGHDRVHELLTEELEMYLGTVIRV